MTKTNYNGWTNYETWNVKLWMDNDQGTQEYYNERATEVFDRAKADEPFTRSERAKLNLADTIKNEYEERSQEILKASNAEASVWGDLMGAALSEVNWHEIANSLLEDNCDEYEADKETA